ncbi:MAG: L,D-transpeptidase [Gemmatimonadaceae bacterium]
MAIKHFLTHGGRVAWGLIGGVFLIFAASTVLLATTADVRYQRDVTRMVFNDNVELLKDVRMRVGATTDSLAAILDESPTLPKDSPYLVVSIEERRVWLKQADSTLYTTQVAVGSGKTLVREGGSSNWKFETPRGRLVVQGKEEDPVWVPPDWHFVEQARKRGVGLVRLTRGEPIPAADGSIITVEGNNVVKVNPDGSQTVLGAVEGEEIVVGGNMIVPPFGTDQRRYEDVLGTHRLLLGDGYALHGTNNPASIGQAVSHGCIRLRNEDIEELYGMVPVGTPVYIY